MLADDIQAAVGGNYDRTTRGGITALAKHIGQAQRFSFGPNACAAIGSVSRNKCSSLVKAIEVARVPFALSWFEWAPHDLGEEDDNNNPMPSRLRALLRCLDETHARFEVTLAWMHRRMSPGSFGDKLPLVVCPIGFNIDLKCAAHSDLPGFSPKAVGLAYSRDPKEQVAWEKLFTHFTLNSSIYMQSFLDDLFAREEVRTASKICDTWLSDAASEAARLLSALCLLNSKNSVASSLVDLSKLNKARSRSGKPAEHLSI